MFNYVSKVLILAIQDVAKKHCILGIHNIEK